MNMNHLSLFTGIGGLDLAAEWAGFHTVGQVEIDDYCNKVLQKHWPDVLRWRDVYQLTGEEIKEKCGSISLLSGGFPCQPFSCAGKRKGTEDERYLWDELLRIICEVRPKWFVGENVRGLLSIDAGRTFGRILSDLAENGYRVGWLCYGAGDVGAPHRRERVFIVAHSDSGRGEQNSKSGEFRSDRVEQSPCNSGRTSEGEDAKGQAGATRQMANTSGVGWSTGAAIAGEIRQEVGRAEPNIRNSQQHQSATEGATESSMGRVPSGFPAKVDGNWPAGQWRTPTAYDWKNTGCCSQAYLSDQVRPEQVTNSDKPMWPAGPGEQHEWEPPRIATGIKDRVARLKCLGNAVVPQQAYPIFKAIAEQGVQGSE